MAFATSTAAIVSAVAIAASAAAAGYSAYQASEAQADDARARKQDARAQAFASKMHADAEAEAAEARRQQVQLQYQRHRDSQRSKAAAAGVSISSGSLLEGQMEAAALAEYEAQLAEHPHQIQSQASRYQEKLFGWRASTVRPGPNTALNVGIATGSSLAAGYGSFYKDYQGTPSTASTHNWDSGSGYYKRVG